MASPTTINGERTESVLWERSTKQTTYEREKAQDVELMQLVDEELAAFELHLSRSLGAVDAVPSASLALAEVVSKRKCATTSSTLAEPTPTFHANNKFKRVSVGQHQRLGGSSHQQQPSHALGPDGAASLALHLPLKELIRTRKIQQSVSRQVNKALAFWFCHEIRMKAIRRCPANGPNQLHGGPPPATQRDEAEESMLGQPREAQVFMMLQRADLWFQQIDLVFQQHWPPTWHLDSSGMKTSIRIRLRRALPKAPSSTCSSTMVNLPDEYAELVGWSVTDFDAQTLLELIWKSCASRGSECCSTHRFDQVPVCKKQRTTTTTHEIDGISSGSSPTGCDQCHHTVTGNVICVKRRFEVLHAEATRVQIDLNSALKKISNSIVIDSIGKAVFSSAVRTRKHRKVQPRMVIEFTRSAWIRVEALEDGRSVLRHVYRMWPVAQPSHAAACESIQTVHKRQQEQLQLMGDMLERSHAEISKRFQTVLRQFGQRCSA